MKWLIHGSSKFDSPDPITVPGDKSISHRALMLAAIASGESRLRNLATGADVRSTAACLRQLGIDMGNENGEWAVHGGELSAPKEELDAGNSGTTMRLLSGILAAQPFTSVLTGDDSLRQRPMRRIAEPLTQMGAEISTDQGMPPVRIAGGSLRGITYKPPTPSAQVKSCVLLAGLFAEGKTTVVETVRTRDHTELMLAGAGVPIEIKDNSASVIGGTRPKPLELSVPGDFSSAAFFLALGALGPSISVRDVGVNPARTALLDVLGRLGAFVTIDDQRDEGGEPVGTITVDPADLIGTEVDAAESPLMLDELPLVAMLGSFAGGTTTVRGAAELRVKESDRIAAVTRELSKLGAKIEELPDGFVVHGNHRPRGAVVTSHGDHRIAMMLAIAASRAIGQTIVEDVECVDISYPEFAATLGSVGVSIESR